MKPQMNPPREPGPSGKRGNMTSAVEAYGRGYAPLRLRLRAGSTRVHLWFPAFDLHRTGAGAEAIAFRGGLGPAHGKEWIMAAMDHEPGLQRPGDAATTGASDPVHVCVVVGIALLSHVVRIAARGRPGTGPARRPSKPSGPRVSALGAALRIRRLRAPPGLPAFGPCRAARRPRRSANSCQIHFLRLKRAKITSPIRAMTPRMAGKA